MILKTLVMEGASAYEKQNGLFPIRWKTHYLTEMFLACLPLKTIDGSSKIVIAASPQDQSVRRGEGPCERFDSFGVCVYHLNDEQVETLYRIEPYRLQETRTQAYKRKKLYEAEKTKQLTPEQEQAYMLTLIEQVLTDIAKQSNADAQTIEQIQYTSQKIKENGFCYEKKIDRLSKYSLDKQYRAEVFRCLSRETGEAWRLHVTAKDGEIYCGWITGVPEYMDRTDFFKHARWENGVFQLRDNLDELVLSLNMQETPPALWGLFFD